MRTEHDSDAAFEAWVDGADQLRTHSVQAAFRQGWNEQAKTAGVYRDVLARIVGAFTSGIYCANCGEGIETCRCIVDLARTALA
jgi:hypothetical protein